MSGCEWFLGATGEFCGAPVEAEGLILCAWHANCEDGNDSHRGPNQPTAQVSGWHPFMRQLGSNMCVCGAADSDPVHTSQAPEPTALDAGGSEGMETAPPAVTIPEDLAKEDDLLYALLVRHHALRIAAAEVLPGPDGQDEIDRERLIEQWVELAHDEAGMVKRPLPSVAVLAQLGDKVGPIVARLAKLDRIEATRRAVKAGPAIPSPSDWEAFIDALDGEP